MFAKLTEASFGGVAHVAARGQDDRALLLHRLIPAPFNIGVKRLKLRLSGSARKNRKNGFETRRGSNFRPFWVESSRFYPAA
jgi:hypothetical protein